MKTKWFLIGRGKNGWHASGLENGNKVSSSGGTLQEYLQESDDGVIIYDAEDADMATFVRWTYRGPMVNILLKNGEVHRFMEGKPSVDMMATESGYQAADLDRLLYDGSHKVGALDYVALDLYMAMMKYQVPGVKTGKVIGHAIQWDA